MTVQQYREDSAQPLKLDRALAKIDLNCNYRPYAAPMVIMWEDETGVRLEEEARAQFQEMAKRLKDAQIIVDVERFRIDPTPRVPLALQLYGRTLRSPEWHKRQRMQKLRRRIAILLGASGGFAMGAALFYAATA